jgi:hypothetical protein
MVFDGGEENVEGIKVKKTSRETKEVEEIKLSEKGIPNYHSNKKTKTIGKVKFKSISQISFVVTPYLDFREFYGINITHEF